jgi:N4-gp56 family major capsid protein
MAVVGSGISGATNVNVSSGLSQEIKTYYDKVFLARAEYDLVLKEGGQLRTHPANEGRTVNFTRYTPLTIVTTPLGEASNPVTCAITACTVAMTLSEYGLTTYASRLQSLISIDAGMKEKIELMGQNMGETLNRLIRAELQNGTSYYPNGHNITSIAAGDVLDACNIRLMVRALEINQAMPYKDGMFIGKTDPYSKYKLLGDTTWVNSHTYKDGKELYKGEMGELYQVRWLLNKDLSSGIEATSTAASTVTRFYTYVHGDNSFGAYDLEKDQPKLYILPNVVDSNSPAGRISIISWAGSYACKLLNSDWVLSARFTAA